MANETEPFPPLSSSTTPLEILDAEAPPNSEEWLARKFAERYRDELCHVPTWGWGFYDGTRWSFTDSQLAAGRVIRRFLPDAVIGIDADKLAAFCTKKKVDNVEYLAKRDSGYLKAIEGQWDADPWKLNTPGGVVDLREGKIRAHRPDDYMTKITATSPNTDGCVGWLTFLDQITGRDDKLVAYLQRVCGYALTGSTMEHAMFFGYGTGGNGKSVFLDTVSRILGDYAVSASMETFAHKTGSQHPTELARLRGARLVTAMESEEGQRWAEAKIKQLTGGDKVAARYMRQDFFEYIPQFKLFVAGNHKPAIRSVDEAMKRRINLIPFAVTIKPEDRDKRLTEKLRAEDSGILRWMIDGCLAWQKVGLEPPLCVTEATRTYFSSEDTFQQFIDDFCELKTDFKTQSSVLFRAWRMWAEQRGEFVGSQKRLSQRMLDRGYAKDATNKGNFFLGIGLTAVVKSALEKDDRASPF